jgi:hypothetical protein
MPVPGMKIRPLEHDDLPGLFRLGRENYGPGGQDTGWHADTLADILVTALPTSLVATRRKNILGFVIAGPLENATWRLYFHGARPGFDECVRDLVHFLVDSLPEGTSLFTEVRNPGEETMFGKIGFTPTGTLTTMTLVKKRGTDE